ncbi:hypothetical protein NX059_011292 [Plenodomus lindquistii]|nr:hypothetical protein NX059_011292 [Plenodomus lindquistii]
MLLPTLTFLLLWLGHGAVASPYTPSIQVRHAPGKTAQDTYLEIRRGLAAAGLAKRQEYKTEINLARSWTDATLLHVEIKAGGSRDHKNTSLEISASIDVICTTCYIRGLTTAQLTIGDDFDMANAIDETTESVRQNIDQLSSDVASYLDDYTGSVVTNLVDGIDWSDFDLPTFPYEFNLDVPEIPSCHLQFQFDDLELYMAVNTVLSAGATYEVNLYSSNSPAGFAVGSVQFGFVLQVDLILAIDGEIDISSGIHIMLDDGVTMDMDLFGNNVTDMVVKGGKFEFLPVRVESGGVTISAALRVGVHVGAEVGTPKSAASLVVEEVRAGVEVAVFANVAEFITNITYAPDDEDCDLKVVQEFNVAVGAIAGASVVVDLVGADAKTWGPVPTISTAIYTTTLAEVCAIKGTPTSAPADITAAVEKRDDLTTTTISTTLTTTGVSCNIAGLAACPASEQVSTKAMTIKFLTTAVPSGSTATFPTSVHESVRSTIAFGSHAKSIKAISGQPSNYVAPTGVIDTIEDKFHGSNKKKYIIGICVGLGVPILLAVLGAFIFFQRRKKNAQVSPAAAPMMAEPYAHDVGYTDVVKGNKQAGVAVSEIPH